MQSDLFRRVGVGALLVVLMTMRAARSGVVSSSDDLQKQLLQCESLRCEYLTDPIGMDEVKPRLSWVLASPRRGIFQRAYQVQVSSAGVASEGAVRAALDAGRADLWDSGKVVSSEQNQIEYAGKPLVSRERCLWRVRAWDDADHAGPWSEPARWEVGLRRRDDWQAKWIAGGSLVTGGPLVVERAIYESADGPEQTDVTDRVRGLIRDGSLNFKVDNETLGGDPAKLHRKQLRLRYRLGGTPAEEKVFKEESFVAVMPPLQYLRKTFVIDRPIVRARLYATALGLYEFEMNGRRVGDHVLAPDWTDYTKRVRYQAYDVTSLVRTGDNAIAGVVADGWYAGHIGNGGYQFWGSVPCVMAQLEVTLDDGTTVRVCTDERWRCHASAILASDIMNGEDYDARVELNASDPGLGDDGQWGAVTVRAQVAAGPVEPGYRRVAACGGIALTALVLRARRRTASWWCAASFVTASGVLVAMEVRHPPRTPGALPPEIGWQVDQPVRELMTLRPKSMFEPAGGHWVFDLGQNMVGVARIRVNAPEGTSITLRFAEMLNPDRTIYTANYRGAASTDTYVCRGGGTETWQPRFTFHGFRYVELTGLPQRPGLDAVVGVVLGSDTPSVGTFGCSDARINQLWSNIRWGQRGNFLSVPTDCPQRDERLGWMGDAEVFIPTAVYNADVSAFFSKWLVDVDDEQNPAGPYSNTSPDLTPTQFGAPAWSDAGVICPWVVYRTYGDRRELAEHLPKMMRWVDWCTVHSDGLIRDRDRGNDYGDWLSVGADTSKELLGTAFFARCADVVARSAEAVGDDADAAKYADLFRRIRDAFDAKYVTADGRVAGETQTGYALALAFDLLPENLRGPAADHLAENVRGKGNHLSTGFVGVSYLLPALANHGHPDVAFDLLMQDTFPSWLFSVKHGATTIWERWDGWTPDKGFQDAGMNSFNHYSLGSCGQWLYESVAGISQATDGGGFAKVVIRPRMGGGLTSATAEYESIRGAIGSTWELSDGRWTLTVSIPPNVTGEVHLPTGDSGSVTESGGPLSAARGVRIVGATHGETVVEVGAGKYTFVTGG